MSDVVWWIDAARAGPALACDSAGVAAVENGDEAALVGKLAIERHELLVGDCVIRTPVEIIWNQALVEMVDLLADAVSWDLGAVARIEEHALVVVSHVV